VNWLALLLLIQAPLPGCEPPPRPAGPPALVVQVVDALWLPIPGARVTVVAASSKAAPTASTTGREGYAEFWLSSVADYSVEAAVAGFKARRIKGVRIAQQSDSSSTAYVQIQLAVAGPLVTVE